MNEATLSPSVPVRPASPVVNRPLNAAWLRELCLAAGADDVGFVEVERQPWPASELTWPLPFPARGA